MSAGANSQSRFIYLLYFLARTIASPLLVLYFVYRGCRDRRYFSGFKQRLGSLPATYKRTAPGSIWLHAVSVGEVISSVRLVDELRAANPAIPIYLSTATLAGRAIAEQRLGARVDGIFFAPIDYTFAVRRVLRRIRPAAAVILETEIWPNLYRQVKRADIGLLIWNGRISDRALPRYRRFRAIFQAALAFPDAIYVQSESDRERFVEIGAPSGRVRVGGNLKYDAAPSLEAPPRAILDLIEACKPDLIWIAASTMPGMDAEDVDESELVLDVFERLVTKYPRLLLIIAPRKPERFDSVAASLARRSLNFVRRSEVARALAGAPTVLLLDTIGELASIFHLGDVVFMGGTLARRGGHNILEPAFAGRPIIIGPHMENFAAIAQEFRAAGALVEIGKADELESAVDALLSDPQRRIELGQRAAQLAEGKRGVTAHAVHEILAAHDWAVPSWHAHGIVKTLAGGLSLLWRGGGRLKRADARPLSTPVISVGGIAMGGTGKTPFVQMLARHFHDSGLRPAILTRGYRRKSLAKMIIIEPGRSVPTAITGDEAQIFVRSSNAHIGICSDRWTVGREMEAKSSADVFLLDDGFQHRRLKRDVDLVLIDALDPFAGGAVFPRGRLREPLTALARAHAFVITRAQPGRHYGGIRARLRELNPDAPVFLSTLEPKYWIRGSLDHHNVVAFCGLGNPDGFWNTLHRLEIYPVFQWVFPDHHHYRPREIRRLAAQARKHSPAVLLTTKKDVMNLPDNYAELIAPVELLWLEVEAKVENERDLFDLIEHAVATVRRRSSPELSSREA